MSAIYHVDDADPSCISGSRIAVVGYGDAGAAWARNLRDGGLEVVVCARPGPSAERAAIDGFTPRPLVSAVDADVLCLLVPDGVVATLPFDPAGWALTIVASGRALATGRFTPNGDVGMLVPKAPPTEVRRRFLSGEGVPAALGVHHDRTGQARARLLALALGIGALGQGALDMTAAQDALLSLAVERSLDPARETATMLVVQAMVARGIPLDAIISDLVVGPEGADATRPMRTAGGEGCATPDPGADHTTNRRIGVALRRAVDELTSGRLDRTGGDDRLATLLAAHDLSVDDLVVDLRGRLERAAS